MARADARRDPALPGSTARRQPIETRGVVAQLGAAPSDAHGVDVHAGAAPRARPACSRTPSPRRADPGGRAGTWVAASATRSTSTRRRCSSPSPRSAPACPSSGSRTDGRRFIATIQAREQLHEARLALDRDGRFVAIHPRPLATWELVRRTSARGRSVVASTMLPGPYRFESAGATFRGVLTNKTPSGAYRGFGMQQATWVRERLVDEAARELGFDPCRAAPAQHADEGRSAVHDADAPGVRLWGLSGRPPPGSGGRAGLAHASRRREAPWHRLQLVRRVHGARADQGAGAPQLPAGWLRAGDRADGDGRERDRRVGDEPAGPGARDDVRAARGRCARTRHRPRAGDRGRHRDDAIQQRLRDRLAGR